MKRKILSLILVFAMTVSLLTVGTGAVEPTYGDTAGHWAESSIERWSGHGIIQGSNGLFDPNGQLTCAQLATILAKLLKLPAAKDAGFTDNTADAWYYDAINRCAAAGILNGNGDSTVTPEAPITRERAIVMLGRALGIEPISKPDLTKYTDAAKVAPYAQGMVAAMIEAGIVGGVTADELAPQDNINRASTVTILDRAIDTYADKAGATVKADGKGIVLVVADDVTVTGDVDKLLVPADNVDVTVSGSKNIDDITVTGDNSKVILNNSTANDVTLDGKNTELETKSGSKVENVSVTEDAKGATVNAGSGTTVKNVENSAADTTITGSGSVKNVASDTDVTVETKGTEVKNTGNDKITVTDAKGKDSTVSATGSGSSTTVNKETTSSGGGYSHSHSYVYSTNWDTLASTKSCSCGASEAVENIYYIANDTQLAAFRDKVNAGNTFAGKTIKLTADIDLNNAAWTPIGTNENPFKGVFDGNDKTISNYSITAVDDNGSGLFGVIAGDANSDFMQLSDVVSGNGEFSTTNISEDKYTCVVKNLNVSNATVTADGKKYVSPVIGAASNAYIANINVTGTNMTVYKYGAGIVAKLDKGVVNNCTTDGTFTGFGEGGGGHIAGIVANVSGSAPFVVMNCTNTANITAQYGFNAGICGNISAANSLIAYQCTNNGAIRGNGANIIAGVVAHSQGGYYIDCKNTNTGVLSGTISDTEKGFGGIAGYITNYSHFFYNCTNTGDMSRATASYVAGICGRSRQATTLYNCKNSGALPTSGTHVAQIVNLTDDQQLYMTITGEMTTEQMIAEINKVSGDKKAVTFAGTLIDTAALTLPAGCESFTSATQTFSNVSLTNCVAVALNIPGEYTLTGLGAGKTVTIGGTDVHVTVPGTESNGGSIKLSGNNITLTNNGTLNHVTFTGEANSTYTLNNNGTITYTTDAGNQHTVDSVGAVRNITIHNYGTIESKGSGVTGSYAMLFYDGCIVAIHDYPDSVISAGERSATYKFISNDSKVSYYLHTADGSDDPEFTDMSGKYGTDLPSRG